MEDSIPVKFQYGASFYIAIITLMGTILNVKALFILLETTKIQNTKHKFLIINLIISELAISCVGIPLDFYHIVADPEDENQVLCSSTAFIHTLFGFNSLFTITAMAVVRYLSVVHVQRGWHENTNESFWSSKHVIFLWVLSLLFAGPPMFGMGQYQKDVSRLSCSPNWSNAESTAIIYNWCLIVLGFLIPTLIIVVSNISVIHKVRKQNKSFKRRGCNRRKVSVFILTPIDILPGTANIEAARNKSRQRSGTTGNIGGTVAVMTVSFYVTWTPYAIRCILGMLQVDVSPIFSGLALLFAKLGVVVNPLLYIFHNQEITGPTITSAVIERRNTLRKRKELKKSFCSVIELQNVDQSKEEECNSI